MNRLDLVGDGLKEIRILWSLMFQQNEQDINEGFLVNIIIVFHLVFDATCQLWLE